MATGEVKTLVFADGVSVSAPTQVSASTTITDTTGWTGSVGTITYTLTAGQQLTCPDTRLATWTLKNASYKQVLADIDCPSSTQVRVTVDENLPVGTYYLTGIY